MLIQLIEGVYRLLWGDLLTLHLGNVTLSLSFMVILLLTAGVFFTLRTRLLPVRLFRDMLAAVCEKNDKGSGLSSFQTLVVSTATRVGMGNLVGVVAALSVGGAGAVFWMWVTALLGASTSFVESTLAQKYKQPDPLYGGWRGGPAYYIEKVLGSRGLALLFSVFLILTYMVGFNMVASYNLMDAFSGYSFFSPTTTPTVVGVVLAVLTALCIMGGSQRLSRVTGVLVPVMGGIYVLAALVMIVLHIGLLPGAIAAIFRNAFDFKAIFGGFTGSAMMHGIKRGLFSNEAGMGSTPHAHAMAKVKHPHEQGVVAMTGVFIDTFVVLTMTALVVISTLYAGNGILSAGTAEGVSKANMAQLAFGTVLGSRVGSMFVAVCLLFFAFSTILSWNFFGRLNVSWLLGEKAVGVYSVLAIGFIFLGSCLSNDLVWELADLFNQLMVLPNVLALVTLGGLVAAACRRK